MLGVGERRFVLLDFLLIVLREARTGSSDTCGYGMGRLTAHSWGETGNSPQPLDQHHSLRTGWRQLSERASSAVQRPPARPGHRFRSHRCGFPAGARSAPPSSLPPSCLSPPSRSWELGAGTRPPAAGSVPGPRGRGGACAGSAGLWLEQRHSQCQGGHAGTRRAHRHAASRELSHTPRRKVPGP